MKCGDSLRNPRLTNGSCRHTRRHKAWQLFGPSCSQKKSKKEPQRPRGHRAADGRNQAKRPPGNGTIGIATAIAIGIGSRHHALPASMAEEPDYAQFSLRCDSDCDPDSRYRPFIPW